MTAVESVSPFMTQDRNPSPLTESQVAKKSTAKPSKYLSDLNNLSQKSADSLTSSSQSSGPLFVEDDSLETEDLNGSTEMIVNGNGTMSDQHDEMLLDGDSKEESDLKKGSAKFDCEKNGRTSPKVDSNHVNDLNGESPDVGQNDLQTAEESPLSSLEAPEGSPLSSDAPKDNSDKIPSNENSQSQDDNETLKDPSDKAEDDIKDNGLDAKDSPMLTEDNSDSNSGSSSRVNKPPDSGGNDEKGKLVVSDSFKGCLKSIVRKVSVQSESDKDSVCSSPKSVGKGNVFENMGLIDNSSQESTGDLKGKDEEDDKSESVEQSGSENKHEGSVDCDKKCENKLLSSTKSEDNLDADVDDSSQMNLADPETDEKTKNENQDDSTKQSDETKDVKDIKPIVGEMESKTTDDCKKEDDILKTDDVVIKHDIEMSDETECDKETKSIDKTNSNDLSTDEKDDIKPKEESESEEKTSTGGVKRTLSPVDVPNTAPKRSKLEEMIGRLSTSVGKKPEEVENMDEDESESSSESETSSENDKQITLSTKELNRIVRKRMDAFLQVEKDKMQKKIAELQNSVEMWKTQAKELQKQLVELSTKSPREKRRPPLKVQAAQYQQGLNNAGAKTAPRTPTTPTSTVTAGRPLLNDSTGQNAITFRNAQMRPIAPRQGSKDTVRTLLDAQRGVVGGIATAGTAPRNIRPNHVKTASAKQLGGCIDLTDDDDKNPSMGKQATAVRTVVQSNQLVSPVVQAPAALGSGAMFLQGSPGGPLVLQPVGTQGMRLSQQGNVVYASAPVRPGMVPQFRPGQQILLQTPQRSAAPVVNRPPPPLKSAPSVPKHPAPLPPTPSSAGTYPKQPPPKPSLKISRVQQGIVLSWNMTLGKGHADITNYQLFAYQETSAAPSTNLWKKVGDVKALPLPMACTLTQFQEGNKYHFAVRAIDTHNRMGPFSEACSIHLAPSS